VATDPFASLPSLIAIGETSLSVTYLAATDLGYIDGSTSAADAHAFLAKNGFDAAPIADARPSLFVDRRDLVGQSGIVLEHTRPLDAPHLVTSSFSLADGVRMLHELPYYFVIERDRLAGIVTRADLQRQTVSMVLLAFILTSEVGMNALIEARLGPDWTDHLGVKWEAEVDRLFQERLRSNAEISRLDCLLLHQRLSLLGKAPHLCLDLGFTTNRSFARWTRTLTKLRDTLAHGGGLLHARPDPVEAIDLFGEVRTFTEAVWGLTE
jgi:CBS domain